MNYLQISFATFCWGFGFISSLWVLESIGPVWQVAIRFWIGVAVISTWRQFAQKPQNRPPLSLWKFWKPGLLLFGLMAFQTWGLKYTTATKSGFITVLYVLFIPIFERILFGNRFRLLNLIWIVIAITGTGLICKLFTSDGISFGWNTVNVGDLLTLICAVFAAGHVVSLEHSETKDTPPIDVQLSQCVWVATLATITALLTEGSALNVSTWPLTTWAGLIQLGVFSTAIGFLIQVRVQRVLLPTTVGLLLLMESPWAMVFSQVLGYEQITFLQVIGAILILTAAAGASLKKS